MKDLTSYIESGVLESYLLGSLPDDEYAEVMELILNNPELQEEMERIGQAMEALCFADCIAPHAAIKPFLLATIDFTTRLENGEIPTFPPTLHEGSTIGDYAEWIDRPDMVLKPDFEDLFAKIIGYTPEQITAIVWIKEMAPPEIHDHEYEKFMVLEGTCEIRIGEKTHHLVAGDYLSIPLHVNHSVTVTSLIPCKVILQRIAC